MLNIASKTDGVSTLPAAEFNSYLLEMENMVTLSGQTLNGSILQQLMNSVSIYANGASSYLDSGSANAYVLSPIGVKVAPPAYFNGMKITFKVGNSNTGASTVNVAGLGNINIKNNDGSDPIAGRLPMGAIATLFYNSLTGFFEVEGVSSTLFATPRIRLGGNATYYVSPSGNDATGNGLTTGTAWATRQKAANYIQNNIDLNGYSITVQCADGTYSDSLQVVGPFIGATQLGSVTFKGNITTLTNCSIITTAANAPCFSASLGAMFSINGFSTSTTGVSSCVVALAGGKINIGLINYSSCGDTHVSAVDTGSYIALSNNETVNGGAAHYHYYSDVNAEIITATNITSTLTGSPSFVAFTYASRGANASLNGITFNGTATGSKFSTNNNANIFTNAAGVNYFPGSTAGTYSNGGIYA